MAAGRSPLRAGKPDLDVDDPTPPEAPTPAAAAAPPPADPPAASPPAVPATAAAAPPAMLAVADLLGRRRVDPDLDLVQLGARCPRYLKEALRLVAFQQRADEQAIVRAALLAYLPPDLVQVAYINAQEQP